MIDRRRVLLRDLEFLKFWSGQSISLLGSQFTLFALPIAAAVTLRATPAQMGLLGAVEFAPGLILGLVAGVVLDRARRRPTMVAAQATSAAVLATIPAAAALHVLSMPQLYAVGFVAGVASTFYGVAQAAFLPTLVGRDRLIEANAHFQTSATAASLVGPGLAGVAVQLLTAPIAVGADAASFVVGAATAAWLRTTEPQLVDRSKHHHPLSEAIEGLALTWRHPLVRGIVATLAIANAGAGMSRAVFVLLFVQRIGVSPAQLGLVFAASGLSSLVGAQVIWRLQRHADLGTVMIVATVLVGVGALVWLSAAVAPRPLTLPLLVAGGAVGGFGLMSYNIPQQAIRQAVIPDQLLARTAASASMVVNAASIVASLAGGALGQLAGLRWTLGVATAITLLCWLPTAISPLRSLHDVPAGQDNSAG
jgi:MFS family permease